MSRKVTKISDIKAALDAAAVAAEPAPEEARGKGAAAAAAGDPGPEPDAGAPRVRRVSRDLIAAPEDMPVTCLGVNGATYFYLDSLGQFRPLEAKEHSRMNIISLFKGEQHWLLEQWGRKDNKGNPTGGLHTDAVTNVLTAACDREGIIDPISQVRGVGAWTDDSGQLVLHLGDKVLLGEAYESPGRHGRFIYPAFPPALRPDPDPANGDAAAELLGILGTWNWADPFMAHLVLGFIGQGYMAAAVRWRTHVILDGERGSGKSSLQDLMIGLFGPWLVFASNVTEAGLRQQMQSKGQPVFIDEFEAGQAPAKKAAVVELLRQASSGGIALRGGDNHVGHSFTVRFPAIVSSIAPVPLLPQDESRMARVKLLSLPEGSRRPNLSPERLAPLGRRLMRRTVDGWRRWPATFAAYAAELERSAGADARMQDTLGTLLAAADLLLFDQVPDADTVADLVARLAAMVAPTRAEAVADQQRCLDHLLSMPINRGGGIQRTVASWAVQALALGEYGFADAQARNEARQALGMMGLRLVGETADGGLMDNKDLDAADAPIARRLLFVANSHPALEKVYEKTPWPGAAGGDGAWGAVLRRLEGARASGGTVRCGGQPRRGTFVPVDDQLDWKAGA